MHLFVDESERNKYLLAATILRPSELRQTRAMLRGLLLPGERRLHFQTEGNSGRRRLILSRLVEARLRARVYVGGGHSERVCADLLEQVVADSIELE